MFEHLRAFSKVIVSGPQRSGTRVCAKMIASSLSYRYVDEGKIGVDSLNRLWGLHRRQKNFVVQCPALSRYVHAFGRDPDTAIVFVMRNIDDIVASQERIGWSWGAPELLRYGAFDEADACTSASPHPATVKYAFWNDTQRDLCLNAFEVEYESLSAHPLWIPKEKRREFKSSQTIPRRRRKKAPRSEPVATPDRRRKRRKRTPPPDVSPPPLPAQAGRRKEKRSRRRKRTPTPPTDPPQDRGWPDITVLVITYDRPDEIRQVITALHERLQYSGDLHWLLADDGSPDAYVDAIEADFPDLAFATSITQRGGWGKNVNTALKSITTDYAFLCEDDYVALKDLNLDESIALMESQPKIGLVRYDGIQGHDLTLDLLSAKTTLLPRQTDYLRIRKKSPHKNVYSNRPHLVHVSRFHGAYGYYPEGRRLGATESTYATKVKRQNGPDLIVLSDGIVKAFEHIGESHQGTEEDIGK